MHDVLLLSTYELGHQPNGLALTAGFLRRAGVRTTCIDTSVAQLDEQAVRDARVIAISVPMHTALRLALHIGRRVRAQNPRAKLCFFGLYATLNRELLLSRGADWVLGGECEEELVRLVTSDPSGEHAPTPIMDRLCFPAPSRDGLAGLERYAKLAIASHERLAGYVEVSRGCLHGCRHCPIPAVYGGRFFVVPIEEVLADIKGQVERGAEHITFGDPDFLNGPGHSMRLVRALHRELPRLTFDMTAKVSHILRHKSLLPEIADSGCIFVVTALESFSDTVLAKLHKGHTRADGFALLDLMQRIGLPLRPSLLPFTPWSTLQDYLELLDVIEERHLWYHVDPIQLAIRLLVPPGSLLLGTERDAGWIGPLDPVSLSHRWEHEDPRMDALQRELHQLVGRAATKGEEAAGTFAAIRDRARAAGGLAASRLGLPPLPERPPRLTEPWFC